MKILTGQVFIDREVTIAPIEGRPNAHIVVGRAKEGGGLTVNLSKLKEGPKGPYTELTELRRMTVHSTPLQGIKAGVLELRRRGRI